MQENNQNNKKWYSVPPGKNFSDRVKEIQKYRTPATKADEFLLVCRYIILPALALWCMVISFASYQTFLAHNFGQEIAMFGAAMLCIVIEMGKIKMGGYTFSKLFIEGIDGLDTRISEFAMWGSITIFAAVTFTMSVINSTRGAHDLALLKGYQGHYEAFTPNTSNIDQQINAANARIQKNNAIKWKGTVTYQAQRAIRSDSKTLEKLTTQRQAIIDQQRQDYEKRRAQVEETTSTGANIVMAAGGWVEALQIITLVLMGSCMRVVADHMERENRIPPTPPVQNNSLNGHRTESSINNSGQPQMFMFNRMPDGNVKSVPQTPQSVPQIKTDTSVIGADEALKNCEAALRRDIPNFGTKYSQPETVSKRINKALDNLYYYMDQPGFEPTRPQIVRFYNYVSQTAFPALDERGWPYEHKRFFIEKLFTLIPEQELV